MTMRMKQSYNNTHRFDGVQPKSELIEKIIKFSSDQLNLLDINLYSAGFPVGSILAGVRNQKRSLKPKNPKLNVRI